MPAAAALRRHHDPKMVVVRIAPAGADKHVHCAQIDDDGDGITSPGPDGHVHEVVGCDLKAAQGHTHELAAGRCDRPHDHRVRHV